MNGVNNSPEAAQTPCRDFPNKDYEYSALMTSLHVSVSKHLLDEHYTVIWANDFYYEIIEYTKAEYEKRFHNHCDLYYKHHNAMDQLEVLSNAVSEALSKGLPRYNVITRMPTGSGKSIWVRMVGTFTEEKIDGVPVVYTIITDIDDLINAQRDKSVTYDAIPGFVAKYAVSPDLSFRLLEANDRFIQFFGEDSWKNEDCQLFRENVRRNAAVFEAHRDELVNGSPTRFVAQMRGKDGREAWLQINAACVDWQGDTPIYLTIYIDVTDITELREMQRQLEEQAISLQNALDAAEQANRAKSEFLSRMSHDIRTPMNVIIGMTSIALSHLNEPERMEDCLKKISISGNHLLGLINDVLDMSKIESGKMTPNNDSMSLPQVLENVVAIIQPSIKAKNQQFFIRLHNVNHENLYCDELRIRQVLINILSNAVKFTPDHGSISMDVEERETGLKEYRNYVFTFTDTGIGMTPEFLDHIFSAFSREKDSRVDKTEGSGLGMAITKKIVEMMDGDIAVSSKPGEGTTFVVELPLMLDNFEAEECFLPGLSVLLVDDDEMIGRSVSKTLNKMGVQSAWFTDGEKALEEIGAAHEQGRDYSAIILDWKMPAMDGLELAGRIRHRLKLEVPILISSAYDWADIEAPAREAGVTGFLSKPLFKSTLCHALKRFVIGEDEKNEDKLIPCEDEFQGRTFLLVEDNELNREIAIELLAPTGVRMEYACNGAEGLHKFETSSAGYYDVILMDVQMPIMDGYEATEEIRSLPREDAASVPILAMTADVFAEDVKSARDAGMNGHLSKPLDLNAMLRELRRVLHLPPTPSR